jgi:hypothetical protein
MLKATPILIAKNKDNANKKTIITIKNFIINLSYSLIYWSHILQYIPQ